MPKKVPKACARGRGRPSHRGGNYTEAPYAAYEMGDRYLRTVFGFLGITDFTTIAAQGLDIMDADVQAIMAKAKAEAEALAKVGVG